MYNTKTKQRLTAHDRVAQRFKELPAKAVDELIAQGDVLCTAGGFCIEHMEAYDDGRDGEIETVQGLPKALTLRLLKEIGLERLEQ